jgi:hypothetical protein
MEIKPRGLAVDALLGWEESEIDNRSETGRGIQELKLKLQRLGKLFGNEKCKEIASEYCWKLESIIQQDLTERKTFGILSVHVPRDETFVYSKQFTKQRFRESVFFASADLILELSASQWRFEDFLRDIFTGREILARYKRDFISNEFPLESVREALWESFQIVQSLRREVQVALHRNIFAFSRCIPHPQHTPTHDSSERTWNSSFCRHFMFIRVISREDSCRTRALCRLISISSCALRFAP